MPGLPGSGAIRCRHARARRLRSLKRLSLFAFAVHGIALLALGTVYLATDEFMSYHAAAIAAEWRDLDGNLRGLLLGMLKGLGGGAMTAGFAVVYMAAASLRQCGRPYRTLLPATAILYSSLLCYATYTVSANTPGEPPLFWSGVLVAVSVLAGVTLRLSESRRQDPR